MLKQLRRKLIAVTMLVFTLMLCVICGLIINSTTRRLEIQSLQLMQAVSAMPHRVFRPNEPPAFDGDARIPFFIVERDRDGNLMDTHSTYYDLSDLTFLDDILAEVDNTQEQSGLLKQYSLRYSRINTPMGTTLVFMDISGEQLMLSGLWKNCLLVGAAAWMLFFGISLLLARWMIRPVEQAWTQQKQFVADASHELKTPLTVILTNAELLQDSSYTEIDRDGFTHNILTMARQMRDLTESLLDLARVDNGHTRATRTPIDLTALVADALLPFEPLCFENGLTLDADLPAAPLILNGSENHLRQVVDILLDNAAKYSSTPGTLHLQLSRRADHVLLTLSNPCPEIPKEELKKIFKRFYRLDKARTERHSYGLGLAIAEAIVREHKGHIRADWKDGRITFTVRLPL